MITVTSLPTWYVYEDHSDKGGRMYSFRSLSQVQHKSDHTWDQTHSSSGDLPLGLVPPHAKLNTPLHSMNTKATTLEPCTGRHPFMTYTDAALSMHVSTANHTSLTPTHTTQRRYWRGMTPHNVLTVLISKTPQDSSVAHTYTQILYCVHHYLPPHTCTHVIPMFLSSTLQSHPTTWHKLLKVIADY